MALVFDPNLWKQQSPRLVLLRAWTLPLEIFSKLTATNLSRLLCSEPASFLGQSKEKPG